MKQYQISFLLIFAILIAAGLVFTAEGNEQLLLKLEDLAILSLEGLKMLVALLIIFLLVVFLGWVIRRIIQSVDENVEKMQDLQTGTHWLIAFAFGIPAAFIQIRLVPWVVKLPWASWVYALFGSPIYEDPPLWWGVYGAIAFMSGYALRGMWRLMAEDSYY